MLSGGKDSLATYFYLKETYPDTKFNTLWVDTKQNFDETLKIVHAISHLEKENFIRLEVDQEENIKQYGYPSDIVPIENSHEYATFTTTPLYNFKIQSKLSCCQRNIMIPVFNYAMENGFDLIVMGDRKQEKAGNAIKDGDSVHGIHFHYPIYEWSTEEVLEYLSKIIEIPEHFHFRHSSLDCKNCTAFLDETKDVKKLLKDKYPEDYKKFKENLELIKKEIVDKFASYNDY